MSKRTRIVMIAVLWALSLVVVGAWAHAQDVLQQPVLYTGDDFGVRAYTSTDGSRPQATLVIRINGRWQEAEPKAARPVLSPQAMTRQPVLYTGQDFGVQVMTPLDGGRPQATPVIRVNGRWREVDLRK